MYFALIQANIDYCLSVWGSCCNTHLNKIQRLQNHCARIVTGVYDYNIPSSDLLLRLNWMPIISRYKYFIGIFMFKCFNNLIPSNITSMFSLVRDTHHHNTRSATCSNNNFNAPIPRTEILKRCLLYHGPVLWNSIPSDI